MSDQLHARPAPGEDGTLDHGRASDGSSDGAGNGTGDAAGDRTRVAAVAVPAVQDGPRADGVPITGPGRRRAVAGSAAGVAMMLAGVLLFAVNDTLGKWLVGSFGVGQLILVRSIAGLCALSPFIARAGAPAFREGARRPGLHLLRMVCSTGESSLFFWALTTLPLAEVMTYYMAGPIYVTALSPFLLGERVGWRRWVAVAVGFGGVVLALHPSPSSFSWGSVCALAGSLGYALFMVTTRRLAGTAGTVMMTWQLGGALTFGAALVLWNGWTPTGWVDLVLMLCLGLGSLGGNMCVTQSLRIAPASVVVPYQYTLILWGMLFGWLFFGELVSALTLLGAAVIVAAGMFIFLREQSLARRTALTG